MERGPHTCVGRYPYTCGKLNGNLDTREGIVHTWKESRRHVGREPFTCGKLDLESLEVERLDAESELKSPRQE